MKILGSNGLGKVLKIILIICFILAIPGIISLPFTIIESKKIIYSMIVVYPNGILMLLLAYQFILMFKSLEDNQPFTYKNVKLLKKSSLISLIMSIIWLFDLLFLVLIIKNSYNNYIITLVFLTILFFGVFIALYIISELIKQATICKEENDLTI